MTTRNQMMENELNAMTSSGIEVFVPVGEKVTVVHGEKKVRKYNLLTNLFFAKGTEAAIDGFVRAFDRRIIFKFQRGSYEKKMIIPMGQMENFRRAINNSQDHSYLSTAEIMALPKGTKVKVTDGPMCDVVGEIVSLKTRGKSTMLVTLPGFLAATFEIESKFLALAD